MARATHLTIGTADRIRLDRRSLDARRNDNYGEDANEIRQEVQVSITYVLDPGDTDLAAFAAEKADEVQRAHEAAWNRIGALGTTSLGNGIPGCSCRNQSGNDDTIEDEDDGPEDGLGGDPMPPGPPPAGPTMGDRYLPGASHPTNGNGSARTDRRPNEPDVESEEEPATGPQRILIRSRAKKAGLTAYALERLLHEQFQVWRIERLSKSQAASLLDALERDLREKGNGSKAPAIVGGGSYAA